MSLLDELDENARETMKHVQEVMDTPGLSRYEKSYLVGHLAGLQAGARIALEYAVDVAEDADVPRVDLRMILEELE